MRDRINRVITLLVVVAALAVFAIYAEGLMPLVEALISGAARAEVIMLEAEVRRLERRIAELEAELGELEKISVIDALAIANSVLVMICIPVLIILNRESEENERSNRDFYI